MKGLFAVLLISALFMPMGVLAQEETRCGDFSALTMDEEVVSDIFCEGNDIYLKINKAFWDADFIVRLSNANQMDYRAWLNGELDRVVKVYRSQQTDKQGYTYRINTSARFVEYWMGERLVLHLERTQ
jgi:hypothetical protein